MSDHEDIEIILPTPPVQPFRSQADIARIEQLEVLLNRADQLFVLIRHEGLKAGHVIAKWQRDTRQALGDTQ